MTYIHTPISTLKTLDQIKAIYLIKDFERKFSKTRDSYYIFTLADATGYIKGINWTIKDVDTSIIGKYMAIDAIINIKPKLNLKINQAKILDVPPVDVLNYQPGLPNHVVDVYWYEILETIKLVNDLDLQILLHYVYYNESRDAYGLKNSPTSHVLIRGGLLQTLYYGLRAIIRLHDTYAGSSIKLDQNYLITAWLLHKLDTPSFYKQDSPLFEKTNKGLLLHEDICTYAKVQQLYIAVESSTNKEIPSYKKIKLNYLLSNVTNSEEPEIVILNTVRALEKLNGQHYNQL